MSKSPLLLILTSWLLFSSGLVKADVIFPECLTKNPPSYCKMPKGRDVYFLNYMVLNLLNVAMLNFLFNFIGLSIVCFLSFNYKNLKIMIIGTLIATTIGLIIDYVSIFISLILYHAFYPWVVYYTNVMLFGLIFFLLSLVLLFVMYFLIIKMLLKVGNKRKIAISSIILSILTNPAWFYIFF